MEDSLYGNFYYHWSYTDKTNYRHEIVSFHNKFSEFKRSYIDDKVGSTLAVKYIGFNQTVIDVPIQINPLPWVYIEKQSSDNVTIAPNKDHIIHFVWMECKTIDWGGGERGKYQVLRIILVTGSTDMSFFKEI